MIELRKQFSSSVKPVVTTVPVPAVAYIRVSTDKQHDGFSPDVQRDAIRQFAQREGYDIVLEEEDAESGHVLSRAGYLRVLQAVRSGQAHAVIVWAFDRLGRDGPEWIRASKELERAGVQFISVKEGAETGGLLRYIHAGIGEEYSIQLARRVRPAMERSVREGTHHGVCPVGYVLKYAERTSATGGRYQAGVMTPDPASAWFVRELFQRYAAGSSLKALATWANTDPRCPKSARGRAWTTCNVGYILRNVSYTGNLRYNRERLGKFDRSAEGDEFLTVGVHDALVSEELFNTVQDRLDAARQNPVKVRIGRPAPLGSGFLRCAACGGRMTPSRRRDGNHADMFGCLTAKYGGTCDGGSYLAPLAHDALLQQVRRLTFRTWDTSRLDTAPAPEADRRAELIRALAKAQEDLKRHVRRFSMLVEDPTPAEIAAHREVGRELSDKIATLEAAIAAVPVQPSVIDYRQLHDEFAKVSLSGLIDGLVQEGMEAELRTVVGKLVASAVIVERIPSTKSKWLRAAVTWTPAVAALIDAGMVTVGADVQAPDYPKTQREAQAAKMKRYYERKKAGLVGVVPPARTGLKVD